MEREKSLVILKPNSIQRGLIGELISRFEKRGMKILGLKLQTITEETATEHYREHINEKFYNDLVRFITSGPSVLMVIESSFAVSLVRQMVGTTDPGKAYPGTIRGDYATSMGHNMIHASDSPESAKREIDIFFKPEELEQYTLSVRPWL